MNYELIESQLKELIESCPIALSTMANAASLIYHGMENLNWAGFYVLRGNELVLGPFIGKPACTRIPIGKGVCGTAVKERRVQRVENVHLFPGHIACDSASQSEIVTHLFGMMSFTGCWISIVLFSLALVKQIRKAWDGSVI